MSAFLKKKGSVFGLDICIFWIRGGGSLFSIFKGPIIFESSKLISTLFCRIRVSFESSEVSFFFKKGFIFLRKSQWKGVGLYFGERSYMSSFYVWVAGPGS